MNYLGIDVGKYTHVASLIDENAQEVFVGFSFKNDTEGGERLLFRLIQANITADNVEIGLEATGHYWLALYSFLHEKGFKVYVINPIQTDGWRQGIEIRKRKTDRIDSILIAELVRYGKLQETALPDEAIIALKELTRFRSYLVDSTADIKRKAIAVLDMVFPEYQDLFSDIFGKTSAEVLLEFTMRPT